MVPRKVTGEIVTKTQQLEDAVELITNLREVCPDCKYETPQGTRDQVSVMLKIHWEVVHGLPGGGGEYYVRTP